MQALCKLVRNLPSGPDLKAEETAEKLLDSRDAQSDGNLVSLTSSPLDPTCVRFSQY